MQLLAKHQKKSGTVSFIASLERDDWGSAPVPPILREKRNGRGSPSAHRQNPPMLGPPGGLRRMAKKGGKKTRKGHKSLRPYPRLSRPVNGPQRACDGLRRPSASRSPGFLTRFLRKTQQLCRRCAAGAALDCPRGPPRSEASEGDRPEVR